MNPSTGSGEELLRSALNKAELEALETLKLQYFQNATRYLAKGDYDNALTEIKRVLLIDPEHRLAREYEVRVSELQAARAQMPKAETAPPPAKEKQVPHAVPVAAEATGPAPAPARKSKKTMLYLAVIAFLLLGTAGVLTLEKVDDEEQPPTVRVAAVTPQTPVPVRQAAAETTMVEQPTPTVQVPLTVEAKNTPAAEEKSAPHSEPARKEQPVSPERKSAAPTPSTKTPDVKQSGTAGIGLLAAVTEKKVETSAAPAQKEISIPRPEVKLASTEAAPPPEPAAPSAPFVAVEKEPRLVRMERVYLPEIALKTRKSGEVKAKVLVDKEGNPQQVEIVSSTNELLNQAVIDALQKSTYSPGMMGNDPVSAWLLIPCKFK